jgi:membrane-associated PAP2 superfamily phosphatase
MVDQETAVVPTTRQSDSARPQAPSTNDRHDSKPPRPPLFLPLAILIALTAVLRFSELDLVVADAFYVDSVGFPFKHTLLARVLHELCPVIVAMVVIYFVVAMIGSRWSTRLRAQRVAASFLLVSMALGPGLVVNTIFKGHFGRPRPSEVTRYGGPYEYRRVWQRGPRVGQSFPSGDASIGFYFGVPAFLVWRRRPRAGRGFLVLGFLMGAAFGLSRIAQGAHWTSDVLWSAGFVYLTGYLTGELFHAAGRRFRESAP